MQVVRPGRRLHDRARARQPARGRARRRRPVHRGDAAVRPLDEPVRDDVRAPADGPRRRLPRPHLHARRRSCRSRPPDARDVPRLARGRRLAARSGADRPGLRLRAGRGPPRRRTSSPSRRRRCCARARSTRRDLERVAAGAGHRRGEIVDATWADNGPGWMAVLLESAARVLAIRSGLVPTSTSASWGCIRRRSRRARAAREWPQHGVDRGGPGDGQPQRLGGPAGSIDAGRLRAPYVGDTGRGDRAGGTDHDQAGSRRDVRIGGRSVTLVEGRSTSRRPPARVAGPGHDETPDGAGVLGAGRLPPGDASGARGGSSRPCPRGCAGSTASRGGPGRGGRPRSSRSAGCGS